MIDRKADGPDNPTPAAPNLQNADSDEEPPSSLGDDEE